MGLIRTYQTDFLNKESEQITYKVFDSEGVYKQTLDDNILFQCPEDLVPLNQSLVKRYDKPLREVVFLTELATLNYINQNSQFLYDTDGWVLGTSGIANAAPTITEATDFDVKPLSGNKYLVANGTGPSILMIKSDITTNTVRQGVPIQVGLSYYVQRPQSDTGKYSYSFYAIIDTTGNGSADYEYDFNENKWVAYQAPPNNFNIINQVNNKWVGFNKTLEPFEYDTDNDDVNIEIGLYFPFGLALGEITYIDNFTIGEKIEFNFTSVKNVRTRFSYLGGFTAKYETKNIMSNELRDDDNFVGQIEGEFERPRDSTTKTLEAIITQEIINDSRDYLTKYEGVFKNINTANLGLHNKLWINFGADVLEEPVSGYLDAMRFDVKAAEYEIKMHIPNQDDDALSTYKSIAE
jgi:hypothetical protein